MKKLVIIPGISGKMGQAYYTLFKSGGYEVVGISSKFENVGVYKCNLQDISDIGKCLERINFNNYKEVYIIHCIGKFLYEGAEDLQKLLDSKYIEKETYNSNFLTAYNLLKKIDFKKYNNTQFTVVAFGSVSDKFLIPWWISYSRSKNLLRKLLLDVVSKNTNTIMINVSSTEKEEERPYADKTFWLTCREVAERSLETILNHDPNYQEIDIIKIKPGFDGSYYQNLSEIKRTWDKDMYGISG